MSKADTSPELKSAEKSLKSAVDKGKIIRLISYSMSAQFEKTMDMVGSSTRMPGRGRGSKGSLKVSPMKAAGTPATAARSPASMDSRSRRSRPSKL